MSRTRAKHKHLQLRGAPPHVVAWAVREGLLSPADSDDGTSVYSATRALGMRDPARRDAELSAMGMSPSENGARITRQQLERLVAVVTVRRGQSALAKMKKKQEV